MVFLGFYFIFTFLWFFRRYRRNGREKKIHFFLKIFVCFDIFRVFTPFLTLFEKKSASLLPHVKSEALFNCMCRVPVLRSVKRVPKYYIVPHFSCRILVRQVRQVLFVYFKKYQKIFVRLFVLLKCLFSAEECCNLCIFGTFFEFFCVFLFFLSFSAFWVFIWKREPRSIRKSVTSL